MAVPKESIAVAAVAQDHGAAVIALGTIGTRQADLAPLTRTLPSKANPSSVSTKQAHAVTGAIALSMSNASAQPPLEAEATQERTL